MFLQQQWGHVLSVLNIPVHIYSLFFLTSVGFSSSYFVSSRVRSTLNTSVLSSRMLGPDEGVWRAALTLSRLIDHVVSRWAGNAGGADLGRAECTATTLRGYTSNHIGDVDGVDLCNIGAVLPFLKKKKHKVCPHTTCFCKNKNTANSTKDPSGCNWL